MRAMFVGALLILGLCAGCPSQWKIHGGPQECVSMCQGWDMELTGMVGVGSQDARGGGATACVCEVPNWNRSGQIRSGAAGTAASTGAIAVMLAEERERQQQQQQQQ